MQLDDPATPGIDVTVFDNAAGDTNPLIGLIAFDGPIGGSRWTFTIATGMSYPVIGTTASPRLDLNSLNVTSSSGGVLDILLSAKDFTLAPGGAVFEVGGTTLGTVVAKAFFDSTNSLFGVDGAIGSPLTFNAGPFYGVTFGAIPLPTPYSLTLDVRVTHTGGALTAFEGSLAVPEPGSLAFLGLGLIVFGAARKKIS